MEPKNKGILAIRRVLVPGRQDQQRVAQVQILHNLLGIWPPDGVEGAAEAAAFDGKAAHEGEGVDRAGRHAVLT